MAKLGPKPNLEWIDKQVLRVDPSYQRTMESRRSQQLVERIAAEFDWMRFGLVTVTRQNCIVDGQHRHGGALLRDDVTEVPCLVLPTDDAAEAARVFVSLNRDRVALTPLALFKAELAAGNKDALQIAAVCKAAGAEALTYPVQLSAMKPHQTQAISTLRAQVKTDPALATKALTVAVKSGIGLSAAVLQVTFRALSAGMAEADLPAMLARTKTAIAAASHNTEGSRADALFTAMTGQAPPAKVKAAPAPVKAKRPFQFDRSKAPAAKTKPAAVRGDVKVRRFEAGTWDQILVRTLQGAGFMVEPYYERNVLKFRLGKKLLTVKEAVAKANKIRAEKGLEPLGLPA